MTIVATIAGVLLAIGAVAAVVRVVIGPSVADRMVALDTLLYIGVAAMSTYVVATGDATYVPVIVVAVLIAFIGTVVVARYIESRSDG